MEEHLAIQKLKDYVDNCDDIERAKKICKAFLNKFDKPIAKSIYEHAHTPLQYEQSRSATPYIPTTRVRNDDYIFMAATHIDRIDFINLDKTQLDQYKTKLISNSISRMVCDMYEKGYVKVDEDYVPATDQRRLTIRIGAYKL